MGPHSFKCGKGGRLPVGFFSSRQLQWGRTLSSAESLDDVAQDTINNRVLQWGRTLSSAESHHLQRNGNSAGECFNGAALFQVRKDGI